MPAAGKQSVGDSVPATTVSKKGDLICHCQRSLSGCVVSLLACGPIGPGFEIFLGLTFFNIFF